MQPSDALVGPSRFSPSSVGELTIKLKSHQSSLIWRHKDQDSVQCRREKSYMCICAPDAERTNTCVKGSVRQPSRRFNWNPETFLLERNWLHQHDGNEFRYGFLATPECSQGGDLVSTYSANWVHRT